MTIRYTALATDSVRAYQSGGLDANMQAPEHHLSDGAGNPCRHCLCMIPKGAPMLVLAHRPFPAPQPYAEIGPIFLCAAPCAAGDATAQPAILESPDYILRGYDAQNRIVYGSGRVVATPQIPDQAALLLSDQNMAYVHVRSARNNCYHLRIDRG